MDEKMLTTLGSCFFIFSYDKIITQEKDRLSELMWFRYLLIIPLLKRLCLDHDIIFYFLSTLKKIYKYNMENGAFAPKEQLNKCSIFHNILKYKGVIME